MKSGSSASISAGGQSADCFEISSSAHKSRPGRIATASPVRRNTRQVAIRPPSFSASSIASSAICLRGIVLSPR